MLEQFDGRESLNSESSSEFLGLGGINLGKLGVASGQSLGSGIPFRSKLLAVTAPRSIELYKEIVVCLKFYFNKQ